MQNNGLDIKTATVVNYQGVQIIQSDLPDEGFFKALTFDQIKSITCVVDYQNMKVIDIETREVWNILRRNDRGLIISDQETGLIPGNMFVTNLVEKDWTKTSLIYQAHIKKQAEKIYKEYLDNFEISNDYIKKIGKMEK